MKNPIFIALFITVFAFIWIMSGVLFPSSSDDEASNADEDSQQKVLAKVRVVDSKAIDFTKSVKLYGRSAPSKNVTLKAEVEGQIIEIIANEGDPVKKNDIILKIDLREKSEKLREARGLVKQRKIELQAAQKLIKRGYGSNVQVAKAQSALESANAELTLAQIDVNETNLSAPFDGVLGLRHVDIGDYLSMGDNVTDIVSLDPLEVTVYVNEKQVLELDKGQFADIEFTNGNTLKGEIFYIAPVADEDTRTFRVDITVPNTELNLPAGMTALVNIATGETKVHEISPGILTLNDSGDVGVKIIDGDDTVVFKPIQIISDTADRMYIKGLEDNARIVTVGQNFVAPGQIVEPVLEKSDDDDGEEF